MGNFQFLKQTPFFEELEKAEKFVLVEPRYAVLQLRIGLEKSILHAFKTVPDLVLMRRNYSLDELINHSDLTEELKNEKGLLQLVNNVRLSGNDAAHGKPINQTVAVQCLKDCFNYFKWWSSFVLENEPSVEFHSPTEIKSIEPSDIITSLKQEKLELEKSFQQELEILYKRQEEILQEYNRSQLKNENKLEFLEAGITELQGKIWGRVYLNFNYSGELFHAVRYFQFEGKANLKISINRGSFERSGLYLPFQQKHSGLAVKAVLDEKFDHLNLVGQFPKYRFGTPSILVEHLINEVTEKMNSRETKLLSFKSQELYNNLYTFKASYYKKDQELMRNCLTITSTECASSEMYDLMVIMLNPGSSKPTKEIEHQFSLNYFYDNKLIPCIPDDTQYQIVKIMDNNELKSCIVLNLFDRCNVDSHAIIDIYANSNNFLIESIFHKDRRDEFNFFLNQCKSNAPILIGWGCAEELISIKEKVYEKILVPSNRNLIGYKKTNYQFYHPWPRGKESNTFRNEWINQVDSQIKTVKAHD